MTAAASTHRASPLPASARSTGRSRAGWQTATRLVIFLAASMLMHLLVMAWLGDNLQSWRNAHARNDRPVEVVLLQEIRPTPPAAVVVAAPPPKRPVVRRRVPKPAPKAITPPSPPVAEAADQSPPPVAAVEVVADPPVADPLAQAADVPATDPGAEKPVEAPAPQVAQAAPAAPAEQAPVEPPAPPVAESVPKAVEPAVVAADPVPAAPEPAALLYGAPLQRLPASGRWSYRVYMGDYAEDRAVASLDFSLQQDGTRYKLRTEGRAEGLTAWLYSGVLTQLSEGTFAENGLLPERYAEQRGKRAERWSQVAPDRREVKFSTGPKLPATEGMQDRLSMLLQLGLIARSVPQRLAAGSSIEIPEISSRAIERVRFISSGETVLETSQGILRGLLLTRNPDALGNEPKLEVWLGYDYQMLPIRIRLTDANGRVLDQLLTRSGS